MQNLIDMDKDLQYNMLTNYKKSQLVEVLLNLLDRRVGNIDKKVYTKYYNNKKKRKLINLIINELEYKREWNEHRVKSKN